jgi:glycine cleavage system H lipoate-binding protein
VSAGGKRKGEAKMVPITVVAVILAFLAVDTIIQYIKAWRGEEVYGFFMPDPPGKISEAPVPVARMAATLTDFGIRPPANVFLHEGHTWTAVEESGEARIGIDALVRKAIGRIDALELPEVGQMVRQGQKLFALRQGERVAEFVAPIDGTVTSVNHRASSPGHMNSSDWICQVRPRNLSSELGILKFAEEGVTWIYQELVKFQGLIVAQVPRLRAVGVTIQDGPLALDSLLENLDDDTWRRFGREFLKRSEVTEEDA